MTQPSVVVTELGPTIGHRAQGPTEASAFTLDNGSGVAATVWDYGAHLVSVLALDGNGRSDEVVLGRAAFADSQGADRQGYQGATVGRYANRIANGAFDLDGERYQLAINDGANHLHGGAIGFDHYVWTSEPFEADDRCGVRLSHKSPAGDEGYPGALDIELIYQLGPGPTLAFIYQAVTDAPTIVNLTNHAYWNLGSTALADQLLQIQASAYLAVDDDLIPTDSPIGVEGTPFDFRTLRPITNHYDHCFVLDGTGEPSATMVDAASGRTMTVHTDQPGLQIYTGQHLSAQGTRPGLCLEAQHLPDSPNRHDFPSPVLRPGETYSQRTVHTFGLL